MSTKETIIEIARSIDERASDERSHGLSNKAIARCHVVFESKKLKERNGENTFFLTNNENLVGREITNGRTTSWEGIPKTTSIIGKPVYKNTKLGEVLVKYWRGRHNYRVNNNEFTIEFLNKATYHSNDNDVVELEIRFADDENYYRYASLRELLKKYNEEHQKILDEKKEEIDLLEKQARQREIERLEKSIEETNKKVLSITNFLRSSVELRSQHILDENQEEAKRSHLYDGCTVIIDGGPGTGKTTTMIQRLKFLLSRIALDEYDNPLSKEQKEYLTIPEELNNRWLFFSPTDLLLQYLRNNMAEEELIANNENTRTIDRFRMIKMRDYGLFNPSKDGPFKSYKASAGESLLIKSAENVVVGFENYCIFYITDAIKKRLALKTNQFDWHTVVTSIKATFNSAKINDLGGLMKLLNTMKDREQSKVKDIDSELRSILNNESVGLKERVLSDIEAANAIKELFEEWKRERMLENDEDDESQDMDEEDDVDSVISFNKQDFETKLYSSIRSLLRKLGLRIIDKKNRLSKRDESLLKHVNKFIDETINIQRIGELAWFIKNFKSICSGLDQAFINQIPKMYKAYRKQLLREKSNDYDIDILHNIISKDNNKHLHIDEQDLLLGFINNVHRRIYNKSRKQFNDLKNKYVLAYKESVRPIIGIDEATDYTLLDYYLMASFRHYDFSTITLCGDIMQGLNKNGIQSWKDLRALVFPNIEVVNLNISYRQLPTLLDISKEMYKDDQGIYPLYNSKIKRSAEEPQPLLLISDDTEEKAVWLSNRIIDIYQTYNSLPSVAIFVGDNTNIDDFIEQIESLDLLDGIEIVDCSGGKKLDSKDVVRVFRLSEVKGMEFECVFFYDIDKAIENISTKMIRRYLYVGVSRATSHLAATMTNREGNESIIKYFNEDEKGWT